MQWVVFGASACLGLVAVEGLFEGELGRRNSRADSPQVAVEGLFEGEFLGLSVCRWSGLSHRLLIIIAL